LVKILEIEGRPDPSKPLTFDLSILAPLASLEQLVVGDRDRDAHDRLVSIHVCKNVTLVSKCPQLANLMEISFYDEIVAIPDEEAFHDLPILERVVFHHPGPMTLEDLSIRFPDGLNLRVG
jgi:hypothetical protein